MEICLVMNTDHDGDLSTSVVTKDVLDWIWSPYAGSFKESSYMEEIPEYVTIWKDMETDLESQPLAVWVTTGSFDNDRALCVNSNVRGYKDIYHDVVEFFQDLRKNGDVVVDVFEGMDY